VKGRLNLPPKPGLGFDLDRDAVARAHQRFSGIGGAARA